MKGRLLLVFFVVCLVVVEGGFDDDKDEKKEDARPASDKQGPDHKPSKQDGPDHKPSKQDGPHHTPSKQDGPDHKPSKHEDAPHHENKPHKIKDRRPHHVKPLKHQDHKHKQDGPKPDGPHNTHNEHPKPPTLTVPAGKCKATLCEWSKPVSDGCAYKPSDQSVKLTFAHPANQDDSKVNYGLYATGDTGKKQFGPCDVKKNADCTYTLTIYTPTYSGTFVPGVVDADCLRTTGLTCFQKGAVIGSMTLQSASFNGQWVKQKSPTLKVTVNDDLSKKLDGMTKGHTFVANWECASAKLC